MIQSTLLQSVPDLIHGFSTRQMGTMKHNREARRRFLDALEIAGEVITPEQIHGTVVSLIDDPKGSDGLVGRGTVGIFTADCVPVLAVDTRSRIVAAVHAGWRGTLGNIANNAIEKMKELGADADNILVWIGPHIGACCYSIPEERAQKFGSSFVTEKSGTWFADIGRMNVQQLVAAGVLEKKIDLSDFCTSCKNDEFFSYRKDSKETFGEMMGVIGWK